MKIPAQTEFAACRKISCLRGLSRRRMGGGFTLVEILIALAILIMIMVAMVSLLNMTQNVSRNISGTLDSFEASRTAFDTIGRTARQATLLSYLGYDKDPYGATLPTTNSYALKSDLHFICGAQTDLTLSDTGAGSSSAVFFQAPVGAVDAATLQSNNSLLNATGFFLAYGEDPLRPAFLDNLTAKPPPRPRFRLFQYLQPREKMTVYQYTISLSNNIPRPDDAFFGVDWFKGDVDDRRYCHVLAENVIALAILPVTGGDPAPKYLWNSRDPDPAVAYSHHRLPQSLKIAMAVIDEQSVIRAGFGSSPPALVPNGLFTETSKFDQDVKALDDSLVARSPKLNYRIFTAEIPLSVSNSKLLQPPVP
jgi:uncharacterized protein (TIGR02599 family)